MGRAWMTTPVLWHSSRIPGPSDLVGLTDAELAFVLSKWRNWYRDDLYYGLTTVAFFCAGIAWLLILNVISHLRSRRSTTGSPGWLDRLTAICRYSVASQYRVKLFGWYSPPLAAIIGVAGMFTFTMGSSVLRSDSSAVSNEFHAMLIALMLAVRPYYWPKPEMGYSMPIATRSGWISIGIMPFMIVFSTKINWVAMLTGTSHEKLQVFHRWSASIMYITSLVHTFPFIVMSIRHGQMEMEWNTDSFYWTGVAALIPQTWLIFMSWGIIRNKYYETFKNWTLTSWDYFWATFVIYLLAFFTRILRTLYNSLFGLVGSLETLPDGMLKLVVQTPPRTKWTPGQHVFIRFLSLNIHNFSSHPFTIASIPKEGGQMELIFAVKGGITKKLAGLARDKPSKTVRLLVDGPYGGIPGKSLAEYDHVYLLAGGSGVTFTLSILLDFLRRAKVSELRCKHIEFVLAVKSNESILWLEDQLAIARETGITVKVHVTQSSVPGISKLKAHGDPENNISNDSIDTKEPLDVARGRPNLPAIIHEACQTNSGSMAIAACGPDSFLYDVRNAVADCQLAIADGYGQCKDLFLHTENYSW
ncbi:hypothetical protein VKT23_013271 [Stygiomarasmius scandens]|uniref:ferric-chelate reductase (NADPH) n=1 Tax=Marasmiellus scandens TaxID=2682957 RepID=A0ABR1J6P0_9AGAR